MVVGLALTGVSWSAAAETEAEPRFSHYWNFPEMPEATGTTPANVKYIEVENALDVRDTHYRIRVPENWNDRKALAFRILTALPESKNLSARCNV